MEFWTNQLGSAMWVFDSSSLPAWRNLQTGAYSQQKPSDVDRSFTPRGPYTQEEAQLFPHASQYISGFPSATGARAPSPAPSGEVFGPPASLAHTAAPPPATTGIPQPQYDDYWEDNVENPVPAGTPGAVHNTRAFLADTADWQQVTGNEPGRPGGVGPVGPTGPTAAELAIERSKVQAQNLATFVSGTIAELESEIDARRLSTEQAIGEFNRRLDAFSEAGQQFQGIQPYTIPIGAEYAPGFQPGGVAESLGIAPRPAEAIQFDPFGMAADIVAETPVLTDIGVPSGTALDEAIRVAEGFLGG